MRRLWDRREGWKGGRGYHTIGSPTRSSTGRRGPCRVWFVTITHKVVQISQQTRKVGYDMESVSSAQTIEKDWLLLERWCGLATHVDTHVVCHGRQNGLMKTQNSSSCPYTITLISNLLLDEDSNLLLDEGGIHMCGRSGLYSLQPVFVSGVWVSIKGVWPPQLQLQWTPDLVFVYYYLWIDKARAK